MPDILLSLNSFNSAFLELMKLNVTVFGKTDQLARKSIIVYKRK